MLARRATRPSGPGRRGRPGRGRRAGLTGCTAKTVSPRPSRSDQLCARLAVAGATVAYVVIRNNGASDRLVSSRTSAAGDAFRARPGAVTSR